VIGAGLNCFKKLVDGGVVASLVCLERCLEWCLDWRLDWSLRLKNLEIH